MMGNLIKENLWLKKKLERSEHERRLLEDSNDKSLKLSKKIVSETNEVINNINKDFKEINENISATDVKYIVNMITNKISSLNGKHYMTKSHFQLLNNLLELFSTILKHNTVNERNTAIAQTTQMLAHDVKKPFSMLSMVLEELESCRNPEEIKEMANNYIPMIRSSITEVNGMVDDVMELGRTTKPNLEPSFVESIIESSLIQATRIYSDVKLDIKYYLNHVHLVNVDTIKVGRVFSNIIENAFSAIEEQNEIWITTNEKDDFMEIIIGNRGSFIPKDDISVLFDAFYTKNKSNGTGLGLAIAQKIVSAHGGRIWCESFADKNITEFYFTLPLVKITSNYNRENLPSNTYEIKQNFVNIFNSQDNSSLACISDPREPLYEREITEKTKNQQIKLAIIDDEAIYRNALKSLIKRSERLKTAINIETYNNSISVFNNIEKYNPDFIICDIDLGNRSLNGFQIAQLLRDKGIQTPICIHSNRSLPEDYAKAVEVGAQAFLPKPMTRAHLLKFLIES